jgi:hypothetical protein
LEKPKLDDNNIAQGGALALLIRTFGAEDSNKLPLAETMIMAEKLSASHEFSGVKIFYHINFVTRDQFFPI